MIWGKKKKKSDPLPSHLIFYYYHRGYYSHGVDRLSCISLVYDNWLKMTYFSLLLIKFIVWSLAVVSDFLKLLILLIRSSSADYFHQELQV